MTNSDRIVENLSMSLSFMLSKHEKVEYHINQN